MRYRQLGKTGLKVTEIGLGGLFTSRFGGEFVQSKKTILRALELGINYIDTAPGYFDSEEVIGKSLEGVNGPLIISTTLGGRPQPFRPQDKECLMKSVEQSLAFLHRDYIDILLIHEPDRPRQYAWWTDIDGFYGPVVDFLQELKGKGIIHYSGLGGTTAYELARIIKTGRFDVVLTATNYSLLWREAEIAILPEAKRQNMGIILGSPMQQGGLTVRYDDEVSKGASWLSPPRRAQYQALYKYLDEVEIPLHELALRFVISNPDISCVLSGARSPEEITQSVAAVKKGPLPLGVLKRLDEIAAMVPFRPYEEPSGLPFTKSYDGPAELR